MAVLLRDFKERFYIVTYGVFFRKAGSVSGTSISYSSTWYSMALQYQVAGYIYVLDVDAR